MVITLHGRVYYQRAYYLCAGCGQRHYPTDQRLGIQPGQMSKEVIKIAALAGIQEAFGTSRDLLARTTLLELSPNSIRKACQIVGEQVMADEQALHTDSQDLERQREHACLTAPKQLCGSLDGFMVLFEDGWHEVKGGTWWTQDQHGQLEFCLTTFARTPRDSLFAVSERRVYNVPRITQMWFCLQIFIFGVSGCYPELLSVTSIDEAFEIQLLGEPQH
jgi:hypothetical protein